MALPLAREADPVASAERRARLQAVAPLAAGGLWLELRAAAGPAARDDAPDGATAVVGDLSEPAVLQRVRDAGDGALVTAFDALEHQRSFVALLEALVDAAAGGATVVLGVPEAAVGEAPAGHGTVWGEGAFAELRGLLPAGHVALRQVALRGSAIVAEGHDGEHDVRVALREDAAPVAWLAAFGPRAHDVGPALEVHQADLAAERDARRALEAEVAVLRARLGAGA
jgi:hypothetical protein